MSNSEGGPRKRPRHDSAEPEGSRLQEPAVHEQTALTVTQDHQYNASDGGICVLRVQNTTFKVHRYLLSRDSVVFRDMFSSNMGGKLNETLEDPIVLHDAVTDFRALCWALYALPTDLTAQLNAEADMSRIFRLSLIANKYQFLSLEKWAIETMIHHCQVHDFMSREDTDLSPPLLLKAATLCGSKELRDVVEKELLSLMEDETYHFLPFFDIIEDFGSRRLRGMACYFLLQRQEVFTPPRVHAHTAALDFSIYADPDSPGAMELNRGFCGLTKWWQHFVLINGQASAVPRAPSCTQLQHELICQPNWPAQFKKIVLETENPDSRYHLDILSRLEAIEEHLESISQPDPVPNPAVGSPAGLPSTTTVFGPCVVEWGKELPVLRQQLIDTMADQFYGRESSKFVCNLVRAGAQASTPE